jgi:hypothetical protein
MCLEADCNVTQLRAFVPEEKRATVTNQVPAICARMCAMANCDRCATSDRQIQDLALLVRRLSGVVQRLDTSHTLPKAACEYLERIGQGSVLRCP